MNKALIIFIKNPILGKAKTRIAKTVGDEKALKIYKELLSYTQNLVQGIEATKFLFYTFFIDENDTWDKNTFSKHLQSEGDLGFKMQNAFETVFKQNQQKILIIGSDCGELTKEIIIKAFQLLDSNDFVIGPAEDGGYYLLGMKKPHFFVFENKKWSHPSLLKSTLKDIKEHNLSYALLPTLNDVDTYDDYLKWKAY